MGDFAPSREQVEMFADIFATTAGRTGTPGELLGRCYQTYYNARHSPHNKELWGWRGETCYEGQCGQDGGTQYGEIKERHEQ